MILSRWADMVAPINCSPKEEQAGILRNADYPRHTRSLSLPSNALPRVINQAPKGLYLINHLWMYLLLQSSSEPPVEKGRIYLLKPHTYNQAMGPLALDIHNNLFFQRSSLFLFSSVNGCKLETDTGLSFYVN